MRWGGVARTKKGQAGADFLITVPRAGGRKLLLESKWTQGFDKGWLAKAREDSKNAGAEVVMIVTRTLPSGVEHLAQMGDVWVTSHRTALALVTAMRQGLIAVERARRAASMDEARVNEVKTYLSGQGLSPSEVMKPYLKAEEAEPKPKRRAKAA